MKLVIKIAANVLTDPERIMKCAHAVADLVHDGHKVVIFHGNRVQRIAPPQFFLEHRGEDRMIAMPPECATSLVALRSENQYISASLAGLGVPVLGLCGSDAGICKLRKIFTSNQWVVETAQIDPRWLHIICDNGAVPILSNLVLASWGEYYLIDGDHMAAVCAGCWNADALVYLTSEEGMKNQNGTLMRWLDLSDIEALRAQQFASEDMLLKLKRCRDALRKGVGRVRILPCAKADVLQSIFSSRVEYGTEIYIGQT